MTGMYRVIDEVVRRGKDWEKMCPGLVFRVIGRPDPGLVILDLQHWSGGPRLYTEVFLTAGGAEYYLKVTLRPGIYSYGVPKPEYILTGVSCTIYRRCTLLHEAEQKVMDAVGYVVRNFPQVAMLIYMYHFSCVSFTELYKKFGICDELERYKLSIRTGEDITVGEVKELAEKFLGTYLPPLQRPDVENYIMAEATSRAMSSLYRNNLNILVALAKDLAENPWGIANSGFKKLHDLVLAMKLAAEVKV